MSGKTQAELRKLKLAELKKLCVLSSLPVSGSKQELVDRILAHEAGDSVVTVQPEEEAELLDEDDIAADDVVVVAPTTVLSTEDQQPRLGAPAENDSDKTATPIVKTDISKMTQEERIALRKQRFGDSSDGSVNTTGNTPSHRPLGNAADWEKRMERARRFGLPVTTVPKSDSERWKARALRFGEGTTGSSEESERKRKRLERFGGPISEEEKKNARAIRFGISEAKKTRNESEGVH
ncbi:SAP domain-containing ribonucleoprotein [Echinococcus granulosus]|uniref:SAP domain containing ribonucleoprotein n=1 Tax=Echinococcus granulosus TaxID=6210 RepID=A0A068WWZ9_ECHGR|nr:SAP domain-containing ribonucleoprotein [Echinococcus granulosus]CDS24689.1 SAP domain containing ribonucleoprotein [Echinococcus granulosus]